MCIVFDCVNVCGGVMCDGGLSCSECCCIYVTVDCI